MNFSKFIDCIVPGRTQPSFQMKKSTKKTAKRSSSPHSATSTKTAKQNGESTQSRYCSLPVTPERMFSPDISPRRMEVIIITSNKWVNGTRLKYYFFKGSADGSPDVWKGSQAQMEAVRKGFVKWKSIGIGLEFEEVENPGDSMVRIGFYTGDGSWSYVGRDILDPGISQNERTMNFGWNVANDEDTILHEIGHTLGLPHEHQNPFSGIVWNEEKVYAALAAPPNRWSREKTYQNIIRKLDVRDIEGSPHDPNSIMHYPFDAGMILQPEQFRNGLTPHGGLSDQDIEYARFFYPPLTKSDYKTVKVGKSESLTIEPGEQRNFRFKPTATRSYTLHTLGEMDTVMVLFEKTGDDEIQIAGDDDSGKELNARIRRKLIKGREYIIRIRLFYRNKSGETLFVIL